MDTLSDYELFLRNGTSFIITQVKELDVEVTNKNVSKLNIIGSDIKDTLVHLNIDQIICIVKRNEYPDSDRQRKWWQRDKNNR